MATIRSLVDEILYEKAEINLKIFYNIDVVLYPGEDDKNKPVENKTPQPQTPSVNPLTEPSQNNPLGTPQAMPPAGSGPAFSKMTEDAIADQQTTQVSPPTQPSQPQQGERFRSQGSISLQKSEAFNIQTIEDLVEFLSTKDTNVVAGRKTKNVKVVNDFVKETVILISQGAPINDLVNKKDKFIVELDYGFNMDDSIGFKINKMSGVGTMSISMKKNGNIIPGPFNITSYNEQLINYRNDLNSPSTGTGDSDN